jgi:DNA-damage-inducible protein J
VAGGGESAQDAQRVRTTQTKSNMAMVDVRVRVEPALKRDAVSALQNSGLSMSAAIRLFLRHVVETGGLPMTVRAAHPKTVKAVQAGRATRVSLDRL